jgi:hypothetical protein
MVNARTRALVGYVEEALAPVLNPVRSAVASER